MDNELVLKDFFELPKAPQLRETNGKLVGVKVPAKWPTLLFPKMVYGIEFEIENVREFDRDDLRGVFNAKEDPSLRNQGLEFTVCAAGNELLKALAIYDKWVPKEAELGERTSTHVHVNALNMTAPQILNFAILSVLLEDFLYQFTIASRKQDVYCVPLKYTHVPSQLAWIREYFNTSKLTKNISRDGVAQLAGSWHKYLGVNLIRLKDLGTFEFRHLHGTKDMTLVINWLNVIGKIKVFAMKHTTKELEDMIMSLNTSSEYLPFLQRVFGGRLLKLFELDNVDKVLEEGVIAVKLMVNDHKYKTLTATEDSSLFKHFGKSAMPRSNEYISIFDQMEQGQNRADPREEWELRVEDHEEDEEDDN